MPAHKSNQAISGKWAIYHGAEIAVIFHIQGEAKAYCGKARYEWQPDIGRSLVVTIPEGGPGVADTEIILSERDWYGQIGDGAPFDCDYCFSPSPMWPPG